MCGEPDMGVGFNRGCRTQWLIQLQQVLSVRRRSGVMWNNPDGRPTHIELAAINKVRLSLNGSGEVFERIERTEKP